AAKARASAASRKRLKTSEGVRLGEVDAPRAASGAVRHPDAATSKQQTTAIRAPLLIRNPPRLRGRGSRSRETIERTGASRRPAEPAGAGERGAERYGRGRLRTARPARSPA